MSGQPVTVWPDEPVEVAARLLVEHAIGCLPVVADEGLVGILTESDLFTVLLRLLGSGEPSSRITLVLPDVPGALGRAMTVVGDLGVNLLTVVTEPVPSPAPAGRLRADTINAAPVVAPWWPPASCGSGRPVPARPVSGACAVAADDRLAAYDFGPDHPFQAGRLEPACRCCGRPGPGRRRPAGLRAAADADLELIHDRDYLEALARFSAPGPHRRPGRGGPFGLVGDNRPFPGMDEAGRLVAGADHRRPGRGRRRRPGPRVRARGRPAPRPAAPGVGFCLVNDVAVAIARCTRAWPLRVLYVDLDAHHGDGVQAAFYDDPRVCTVSLHETGRYLFPGSGEVHELGRPPGTGAA